MSEDIAAHLDDVCIVTNNIPKVPCLEKAVILLFWMFLWKIWYTLIFASCSELKGLGLKKNPSVWEKKNLSPSFSALNCKWNLKHLWGLVCNQNALQLCIFFSFAWSGQTSVFNLSYDYVVRAWHWGKILEKLAAILDALSTFQRIQRCFVRPSIRSQVPPTW